MSQTPRFLFGRDDVQAYLQSVGDRANFVSGGLNVTRTDGGRDHLVFANWNHEQGVVRFFTVVPIPVLKPEQLPEIQGRVLALNAELALGEVLLFRRRLSVRSYVFFNHDGSLSTRVVESCMRLVVETSNRAAAHVADIVDAA